MGVDAEMFVRIRGRQNWLPPEQVIETAYALSSTVGYETFFISKDHHALSIMAPIKDLSDAEDYGLDADAVGRVVWCQDGKSVIAAEDEQFIRVHLWTRYYGEGYARGDWKAIRAVAEWLQLKFPTGEVWYGGDSSGICAEHLTKERLDALNSFYLSSGRSSYTRYSDNVFDRVTGHKATICPCCHVRMIGCGGGRDVSFWYCDGCGKKAVTDDSGTKWLKPHADWQDRYNPEKVETESAST